MDDPDAPVGVWTHWLLYDIPANVHSLAQGLKPSAVGISGTNDFGRPGYGGPCPPKGHGAHRYYFKLFALDVPTLGLAGGAKRRELDRSLKGRILSEASYIGRYERDGVASGPQASPPLDRGAVSRPGVAMLYWLSSGRRVPVWPQG
jgi:Raf kinase inhibitor-like YbhB/YbcL family protein